MNVGSLWLLHPRGFLILTVPSQSYDSVMSWPWNGEQCVCSDKKHIMFESTLLISTSSISTCSTLNNSHPSLATCLSNPSLTSLILPNLIPWRYKWQIPLRPWPKWYMPKAWQFQTTMKTWGKKRWCGQHDGSAPWYVVVPYGLSIELMHWIRWNSRHASRRQGSMV